jgi:hypothetical protein
VVSGPTSRAVVLALGLALPLAAAVLACTAGDELAYTSALASAEGGPGTTDGGADTGRLVTGSTTDASERASDGSFFPAIVPIACTGLGSSCEPTAGLGCCLRNVAGNVGGDNLCFEQAQTFGGTSCHDPGDVFLACLTSDTDSTCCWTTEANGTANTRYRAACTGGVEACDPTVGLGVCSTGAPCTAVTCKGVQVGYCGTGTPPCQP